MSAVVVRGGERDEDEGGERSAIVCFVQLAHGSACEDIMAFPFQNSMIAQQRGI